MYGTLNDNNLLRLVDAAMAESTQDMRDHWAAKYVQLYFAEWFKIEPDNSGEENSGYLVNIDLTKIYDEDEGKIEFERLEYTVSVVARLLISSRVVGGDLEGFGLTNLDELLDLIGVEPEAEEYEEISQTIMELALKTFQATGRVLTNVEPEVIVVA